MLFAVKILKYLAMIGVAVSFYFFLYKLLKRSTVLKDVAEKEVTNRIAKEGKTSALALEMSKYGIMYRMENYELTPTWYIFVRLMTGAALFAVLIFLDIRHPAALLAFPAGYYGLPFLFKKMNETDNKEMLMDIFNTYANINIQLKVGLYIANALEYSYYTAKSKRYKEAMAELILNMSDKTVTMEQSINIFNSRFASEEIDKLCAMIKTLLRYGNNNGYSQDLMDEIKAIIQADAIQAESDIDTKANMISFSFFAIVIVVVAYTVMTNFSGMDFF